MRAKVVGLVVEKRGIGPAISRPDSAAASPLPSVF
jgi:hypothetical protein